MTEDNLAQMMKPPLIDKQENNRTPKLMKPAISINKFLKVIVVTQRAKQILKGARTFVQGSSTRATRIALEEVEQGPIGFEFIPKDPNFRSWRDNRSDRGQDDVGEDSREVTNQAPVTSQTSVTRLGGQGACFFPIHRCASLDPKTACHCSIIGMNGMT
jgi:DNA-directed RNA polymerase subunit K/omega